MEVFTEKITTELHLSTDMDRCRHVGGSVFEFCLDYLEIHSKENEKIGIKNIVLPEMKKIVEFQCFVGNSFEQFNENKMKTFSLKYGSFQELADVMEVQLNSNFRTSENVCLDFSSTHSQHMCRDEYFFRHNLNIVVNYRNDRFFLYIKPYIRLFMSNNVVKTLGFLKVINDKNEEEKKHDYCVLEKSCYCSDDTVSF